jgi:hypothetical protein
MWCSGGGSITSQKSAESIAIINVLSEYRWHPFIQIFARFPMTVFLYMQCHGFTYFSGDLMLTTAQLMSSSVYLQVEVSAFIIAQFFLIFASIGYVVVFTIMNPKAYQLLRKTFCLDTATGHSSINFSHHNIDKKDDHAKLGSERSIAMTSSVEFPVNLVISKLTLNSSTTTISNTHSERSSVDNLRGSFEQIQDDLRLSQMRRLSLVMNPIKPTGGGVF